MRQSPARPAPGEARTRDGGATGRARAISPERERADLLHLPGLDWDLPEEPPRRLETAWYPAQELQREGRIIEEHEDHVALRTEGSLQGRFEFANPATEVSIWAWGREARGQAPRGRVWLNGEFAGEFEARSPELRGYTFPVWGEPTEIDVKVRFVNDYFEGHGKADRDLFIHGITITMIARDF